MDISQYLEKENVLNVFFNFAGDVRVNENPALASYHTLFVREHNRIAKELFLLTNWKDERLFQEARRLVGAMFQHIIYNEFLPLFLGDQTMKDLKLWSLQTGFSYAYNASMDPTVRTGFSTAAMRVGHSLLEGFIRFIDGCPINQVDLGSVLFRPDNMDKPSSVTALFRGLTTSRAQTADRFITDEVTRR